MSSAPPLIFAPGESGELATAVARQSGIELAPLEDQAFEEGEFKLRPLVSVRDRSVFVVQSLAASPDVAVSQRLIRLLFLLFGLRDAGASRVTAVVPYLSYARTDRRTQLRDPVNTRYVAQLLETTGLDRLVCLDVHNPAALDNAFRIPVDHLSAIPMFVRHFAERLGDDDLAVASPDVGGIKRAQIFREMLSAQLRRDVDMVFVEKRRTQGAVSGGAVVGASTGRTVIVIDDLCASGETLLRAATALREAGAKTIHVAFTHAPLARGLLAVAASKDITSLVTTDSVGPETTRAVTNTATLTKLHMAPLLGEAIRHMVAGAPLAPLLNRWPPIGS